MGTTAQKTDKRFTYGDYLSWHDDERWELIRGEAFNMTPAPSRQHQSISGQLFLQFAIFLSDKPCKVYSAPFDVRLADADEPEEEIRTVVQPDLLVVCDPAKLDDRGCKGAPDLIVEVLSPATARKDLKEKLTLYEKAGVREYWLADPAAKTVMVFKHGAERRYGRPEVYTDEDRVQVGIFDDLTVDLRIVFRE